jgi:spore maturation protein CgeB
MRILAPLLRYDYGDPRRGDSLEKTLFAPAIAAHSDLHPFWLEDNGFPSDIAGLQKRILAEAERLDPDLVFFILMRDEVRPETIMELGKRRRTANWFADDQWRFESFTKNVAPLLSYPITVDKYSLPKYRALGCKRVILSQWASPWEPLSEEPEGFEYEVSFIGGRNSVREWYVRGLEAEGIKVSCFGAGWSAGRVSFDEMRRVVRRSKISLNLSNSQPADAAYRRYALSRLPRAAVGLEVREGGYIRSLHRSLSGVSNLFRSGKRVEQIKARNFEIPAWGGFQLSQFALGIEDYFVPGKEISLFSSASELAKLVKYYLENDEEREAMRKAGNLRAAEHTYERRFEAILKEIERD